MDNGDFLSMLDVYGEVMTDQNYITNPAIGRDEEIKKMILALLSPEKSALLVGKPGIGKTAIVEGLSYKIQNNDVPDAIKGWKILKINVSSLFNEVNHEGMVKNKIDVIINELSNISNVILFIDETHLLVSKSGGIDLANLLKPFLDRGKIKMIGATTTEEYETYILKDRAFLRRFLKIDVAECTKEDTVKILIGTIPKLEKKMNLVSYYKDFNLEKIMTFIVEVFDEYKRVYEIASRYPDICLTFVSSAFTYALYNNEKEVKLKHYYEALLNTSSIYEDVKLKEIERFKTEFKDFIYDENIQI